MYILNCIIVFLLYGRFVDILACPDRCEDIPSPGDGLIIDIGNLHFQQTRDYMIRVSIDGNVSESNTTRYASGRLKYTSLVFDSSQPMSEVIQCNQDTNILSINDDLIQMEIEVQTIRCMLIEYILVCYKPHRTVNDESKKAYDTLIEKVNDWLRKYNRSQNASQKTKALFSYVNGMHEDITGQITEVTIVLVCYC